MIYEKIRIKRIIQHKDTLEETSQIRTDIEWLIEKYNDYFVQSKDYERQRVDYSKLQNKFYDAEDEKVLLKELIIKLRRKIKTLQSIMKSSMLTAQVEQKSKR